jgi:hypothetical protein
MLPNDVQRLLQYLRQNPLLSPKFCDNCGNQHVSNDLQFMSFQNSQLVFQLSCQHCGLVQMLRLAPGGPLSIQRLEANNSDVQGGELQKFAGKPSVDQEEALEVYEDMLDVQNVDDFLALIEQPRRAAAD